MIHSVQRANMYNCNSIIPGSLLVLVNDDETRCGSFNRGRFSARESELLAGCNMEEQED